MIMPLGPKTLCNVEKVYRVELECRKLKFQLEKAPSVLSHTKLPMFPSSVHFRGLEAVAS